MSQVTNGRYWIAPAMLTPQRFLSVETWKIQLTSTVPGNTSFGILCQIDIQFWANRIKVLSFFGFII